MKLLAIDPGKTVGLVFLETHEDGSVLLTDYLDTPLSTFEEFFPDVLDHSTPDVVVIEDYRIFASHSKIHIGAALITPELIGFVSAHCRISNICLIRIQPNEKTWWPEARLKARHPDWYLSVRGHARDALKIALVYLEKEAT